MDLDLERQLLGHAHTVRSLAAALLGSDASGQDIAQETLLAAIEQPPRATGALRAWMLQVGRRLASRWRRQEARRHWREQLAARAERLPSAADDAQRAELLQAIAAAVAGLPSLLREVVLLRHYDELPPRAIAARLGASVAAVEARLRRAHAALRAALQQHARGGDWRRGLLLFAGAGAWTTLPGAVAVTAKSNGLIAAAVVLLLLGGGALLWWPSAPAEAIAAPSPVAAFVGPQPTPTADLAPSRTELAAAAKVGAGREPRPSWTAQLVGRVVDERHHPLTDVPVMAQADDGARGEGVSDASGRFSISLPVFEAWRCSGEIMARRFGLAGVADFSAWTLTTDPIDVGALVLAATGTLQVQVRRGAIPVPGAMVKAVRAAYSPGLRHQTLSDDRGTASIQGLCPNRYCVAATAPDGSWALGQTDVLARGSSILALDLLATSPVEISVGARNTGEPIAAAALDVLFEVDHSGSMPVKLPLRLLVTLPHTDAAGHARITGLCRGQFAGVGATHPDWRPTLTWNAPRIDWSAAIPHAEVQLDGLDTVTWQLVDGEVPLPADGTMFTVLETRVPLRHGSLRFDGQPLMYGATLAVGPGCCALLHIPQQGDATEPVPLQRTHRLVIELRDSKGQPCAGWPLSLWGRGPSVQSVRTGADGRAVADGLPAGTVTVHLEGSGPGLQELGRVELGPDDGFLAITRSPARRVRAQVYVRGQPALPGNLQLGGDGYVDHLQEDVDRGVLTFDLWPNDASKTCQIGLSAAAGLSPGRAKIAPGTEPVEVEFRLDATGSGTVELVPPADGICQLRLERYYQHGAQGWWDYAGQVSDSQPQRLWSLSAGRYRLRDTTSGITGPEVEVTANGIDARLTLDLARVVPVRGRVTASAPLADVAVVLRDQTGAELQRKLADDDGTFSLRVNIDRAGLVLLAVRGAATSAPLPVSGAMRDVQFVLPE